MAVTREMIYDLETHDLIDQWNNFCDENSMFDDRIEYNDEDFLSMFEPLEIAQKVSYGEYDYTDEFITFNGMGNFHTLNYFSEIIEWIDIDAMIDWMNDNEMEVE
jgi:hypothetical protein